MNGKHISTILIYDLAVGAVHRGCGTAALQAGPTEYGQERVLLGIT